MPMGQSTGEFQPCFSALNGGDLSSAAQDLLGCLKHAAVNSGMTVKRPCVSRRTALRVQPCGQCWFDQEFQALKSAVEQAVPIGCCGRSSRCGHSTGHSTAPPAAKSALTSGSSLPPCWRTLGTAPSGIETPSSPPRAACRQHCATLSAGWRPCAWFSTPHAQSPRVTTSWPAAPRQGKGQPFWDPSHARRCWLLSRAWTTTGPLVQVATQQATQVCSH